jgi:hypothetical protein
MNEEKESKELEENLEAEDHLSQNENVEEDEQQEEEEGSIEDIDEELEIEGFHDEKEAEKLTLKKIKQYNEALEQRERVEFEVEYEGQKDLVYVTIEKNFTRSNIMACLQEYVKKLDVLKAKKIEIEDGFFEMYLIFQMIKHFTDIDMPKSIENQLTVLERLVNTGLLFEIFAEFPKEQIEKLMVEISTLQKTFEANFEEFEKQMKEFNTDQLQSETVKKMVEKDFPNKE